MSRYTKSMTQALQQVGDRTQEFDEAMKWEVKITGLPTFYSDGKSRGEVKQALRKLLKRPDDIVSIERTTPPLGVALPVRLVFPADIVMGI